MGAFPGPRAGSLAAVVAGRLDGLAATCALAPASAVALRRLLALFAAQSLDRSAAPPFDGLSFINASGLPFQWVLNFAAEGAGLGFLCEVGRPGAPAARRLAQTLDRVAAACRILGWPPPDFLPRAAEILLPGSGEPWPQHWRSAAWVGVAARGAAVAVKPYFNLNRGTCRERWLRAGRLLKALGRERALARLCGLSTSCSPGSWPVGLALDIRPDREPGRLKLYFRSQAGETLAWLARWHAGAGLGAAGPRMRRFLDLLGPVDRRRLPQGAMVVSLEIHADEELSLKTDLAITKWTATDGPLIEAAGAFLAESGGGAAATLTAASDAIGVTSQTALARFAGLGLEPDGSSHLNLYFEPALQTARPRATGPPRAAAAPQRPPAAGPAIAKGAAALLGALDDDRWEDFALPVGRSDTWVTAYVLAMLADLGESDRGALRPRLAAPLRWLAGGQLPGGGWGYNRQVPADADSTAWAILALRGWNAPVPPEAVEFLETCRRGAQFATYPAATSPARAWAAGAPEIGAVAARVLGPNADWAAFLEADRLPPAYWWTSPIYTTAMLLDALPGPPPAAIAARLAQATPAGAFERALLLRAAYAAGLPADRLADELVREQREDGLWPAAARLRLVADAPGAPWLRIDSGTLYTDTSALFTTATAVAALARATGRRRS